MAVSRISVGTVYATPNTAATPMTATGGTMPTHATGDLLLMFTHFDTGATTTGTLTAPSGWGDLGLTLGAAANSQLGKIYYKVAASSGETFTSPTFTNATTGTTGGTGICTVVSYRGVDTTSMPSSALAGNGTALNQTTAATGINTITGFTPTVVQAMIVIYGGKSSTSGNNPTGFATLAGSDGAVWAEAFDTGSTNAGDAWMVMDDGLTTTTLPTIATKSFTQTGGGTSKAVGIMFALKPLLAKAETLIDDFTGTLATNWNITQGAPTFSGGKLVVGTTPATFATADSNVSFNLVSSYAVIDVTTAGGTGGSEDQWWFVQDANNSILFDKTGTTLITRVKKGGANTDVSPTYVQATHRYWRMQESGGNIILSTSPDSLSWTTHQTTAWTVSPANGYFRFSSNSGLWTVESMNILFVPYRNPMVMPSKAAMQGANR
jgi:hypothetical protein